MPTGPANSDNVLLPEKLSNIVDKIRSLQARGCTVGVHCGAGDGRSGVVVTAVQIQKLLDEGNIPGERNDPAEALGDMGEFDVDQVTSRALNMVRASNPSAVEMTEDLEILANFTDYAYAESQRRRGN